MNTQKLLVAVLALQSVMLLGQWTGSSVGGPSVAAAQEKGNLGMLASGQRDMAVVEELRALNGKVERLIGLLESGRVQVQAKMEEPAKPAKK